MGKAGDPPESPDPEKVIPLQTEANLRMYRQALGDSRADQYTPFGSSTWQNNRVFDQAGYDAKVAAARAAYDASNPRPADPAAASGEMEPIYGGTEGNIFMGYGPKGSSTPGSAYKPFDPNSISMDEFYKDDWVNKISLSPEQQQLYDKTVAAQIKQSGLLGGAIDRVSGALGLDGSTGEGGRSRIEDAIFNRSMRLLQPQMDRARQQQDTQLQQSGFQLQNPEYERLASRLDTDQMNMKADIADRAVLAGGAEQDRILNQLASIRSGTQITSPGTQSSFGTPGLAAPDVMGAYQNKYEGDLAAHNADVQSDNAMMSAIMQAAMAAMTGGGSLALTAGAGAMGGLFGGK